jgi:hypothetical protein
MKKNIWFALTVVAMIASPVILRATDGGQAVLFRYKCGSLSFEVEYSSDGKSATIKPNLTLEAQSVESGIYFVNSDSGAELRGSSHADVEIKPGEMRTFIKCEVVDSSV